MYSVFMYSVIYLIMYYVFTLCILNLYNLVSCIYLTFMYFLICVFRNMLCSVRRTEQASRGSTVDSSIHSHTVTTTDGVGQGGSGAGSLTSKFKLRRRRKSSGTSLRSDPSLPLQTNKRGSSKIATTR